MKREDSLLGSITDSQKAEEIVTTIRESAAAEAEDLLRRAKEDAGTIIAAAKKEAAALRSDAQHTLEQDEEAARERKEASLKMEKKKILLSQKNMLVEEILQLVRDSAGKFRGTKEYALFLRKALEEGIKALHTDEVEIFYAAMDEKIVNELTKGIKNRYEKVVFKKSEFKDIGIIIQSKDGKVLYDNRFQARLKRKYDEVYMRLMSENRDWL